MNTTDNLGYIDRLDVTIHRVGSWGPSGHWLVRVYGHPIMRCKNECDAKAYAKTLMNAWEDKPD